jgi:hypothetical protein
MSPVLLRDYRLLAKHQEHQLFFLPAHFSRDVMEAEIVPQVFHLHLHELLSLKGCSSEPLAEKAEAGPIPLLASGLRLQNGPHRPCSLAQSLLGKKGAVPRVGIGLRPGALRWGDFLRLSIQAEPVAAGCPHDKIC